MCSDSANEKFYLSNNQQYIDSDIVWVEVQPVKWLVDEKSHIMITEKIIFAGVQFEKNKSYDLKNFDKTNIKQFMDKNFSKDLVQSIEPVLLKDMLDSTDISLNNEKSYNLDFFESSEEANIMITNEKAESLYDKLEHVNKETNIDYINQINNIKINNKEFATILTYSQFKQSMFDDKKANNSIITDFAIIQGGFYKTKKSKSVFQKDNLEIINTGVFGFANDYSKYVNDGNIKEIKNNTNNNIIDGIGVKPALKINSVLKFLREDADYSIPGDEVIIEVEYGKYPKESAPEYIQHTLDDMYYSKELKPTGNYYTDAFNNKLIEYEYAGNRFVRAKVHTPFNKERSINLSNGCTYYNGQNVWVIVRPLKWILDKNYKTLLTKDIVIAGLNNNALEFVKNRFLQECLQDRQEKDLIIDSQTEDYYMNQMNLKDLANKRKILQEQVTQMKNQVKSAEELLNSYKELTDKNVGDRGNLYE